MSRKLANFVAEQERIDASRSDTTETRRFREIALIDFCTVAAAVALLSFVAWVVAVSL